MTRHATHPAVAQLLSRLAVVKQAPLTTQLNDLALRQFKELFPDPAAVPPAVLVSLAAIHADLAARGFSALSGQLAELLRHVLGAGELDEQELRRRAQRLLEQGGEAPSTVPKPRAKGVSLGRRR